MTENQGKLFISNNNLVSLHVKEDYDLDLIQRLFVKSSNNLKLELKYPRIEKIHSPLLGDSTYLKIIFLKVKPPKIDKTGGRTVSLCESLLGLYPNLAYDSMSRNYKIVIQGFVPNKPLAKQQDLRIGDLLYAIDDMEITSENIESILNSIKSHHELKITALSPITYLNLNTYDDIVRNWDLIGQTNKLNKKLAPSKTTTVVKGDRVKFSNQPLQMENLTIHVMILSADQDTFQTNSNEKNQVYYKFPSDEILSNLKSQHVLNLNQLFETVRGVFMTLAYSVKELNNSDQAISCTIQYQNELYNVCFMEENFGNKGLMVLIVPGEKISLDYLQIVAKNLNDTFQLIFGKNIIKKLGKALLDDEIYEKSYSQVETKEVCKIKLELDRFFNQLNKHLNESSLFDLFDNTFDDSKANANNATSVMLNLMNANVQKLNNLNRFNIFNEMKGKFMQSIPIYDLPFNIKTDLHTALANLEAQEFVDLENSHYKYRRLFSVVGSCMFFRDYLIVTHLSRETTRKVYNFCSHYDFFVLNRNGNTNQFHVWREIHLNKSNKSRHFVIIVILREFLLAVILESGGEITRELDKNIEVEPDPFFIQQATFLLSDIYNNDIMLEINKNFASLSPQIMFNVNRFVQLHNDKPKTLLKTKSNSRSPIRFQSNQASHRSLSSESRNKLKTEPLTAPRKESPSRASSVLEINRIQFNLKDDENVSPNNQDSNSYYSKKINRYDSLSDLIKFTSKFVNVESTNKYFFDLPLNESVICYASTEGNINGIIFSAKMYDVNSNLFTRIFYNYINSCFKIKKLLDNASLFEKNLLLQKTQEDFKLIEQGVLFKLLINDETRQLRLAKNPDRKDDMSKMKEMNFWVVGRRKFKRDSNKPTSWTSLGDFFVCFNDSLDQILMELAFDVGFSKLI